MGKILSGGNSLSGSRIRPNIGAAVSGIIVLSFQTGELNLKNRGGEQFEIRVGNSRLNIPDKCDILIHGD